MELPAKTTDDGGFDVLGYYSPLEAERFLDALQKAGIAHLAEVRDQTLEMTPIRSNLGGFFGQGVQMLISAESTRRDDVSRIHEALFGDCLPNYDSSFFRGQNEQEAPGADQKSP
jgi:hypothetical protein